MSSINIVQGDSVLTINQGGASGSTGVRFAGAAFRQAGAEARRVLINRAAVRLGVPADRLAVNDGVVSVVGDASKKISYADLVGGQRFDSKIGWNDEYGNALALTSPAKPKTHDQYKIVGTPQKRMDVAGKVFGTKPWVGDIRVEGMVHGRMIRPPVAGASVVSVDESSIAHIPGAQVVRKGDFIGVVAPKEWNAIKAAQVLRVTWSDAKAPFVEMNDLYTHIRNAPATNRAGADRGEVDGAFARAARVITAEYEFPFQSHASMGPGVAVADVRPEGVKVWTGTQKPHFAASGVAGCLGIAPEKVHAVWVAGAGCYGRNDAGDVTMDAAVMSQIVGKPVRVQYMRHEGTGWDPKAPASIHRARAALDENGNLIAFDFYSKGFSRLEQSRERLHVREPASVMGNDRAASRRRIAAAHLAFARSLGAADSFRERILRRRDRICGEGRSRRVQDQASLPSARYRGHQGRGRKSRLEIRPARDKAHSPRRHRHGPGYRLCAAQRNNRRSRCRCGSEHAHRCGPRSEDHLRA
jgi:CO/xanthine dehydrogenase Mo-binding subunit